MISGLNTSGGVQRRFTTFSGAAEDRGRVVGRFGLGGGLTACFGGGGGWPWTHWDLGRSHSSQ
jgi:hypothetical protein